MSRPYEKHTEEGAESHQDTTYSQHLDDPTPESNPAGNPDVDPFNVHYAEHVDRDKLLRNIDKLNKVDLVRLSRASYLKHANRYNVKN